MPDDKSKRKARDSSRLAAGERCEVAYGSKKPGISPAKLRAIIKEVGNDRREIEAVAKKAR
jgi:hypothetical protein